MKNLTMVLLAMVVGCTTAEKDGAVKVEPAKAAVAAKPQTFQQACQAEVARLRKVHMHAQPPEVMKIVPPAWEFLRTNETDSAKAADLVPVRAQLLKTLARGSDFKAGAALAKALWGDAKLAYDVRLVAADYLVRGALEDGRDEKTVAELLAPFKGVPLDKIGVNNYVELLRIRTRPFIVRNDKAGALRCFAEGRAELQGPEGFKAWMNGRIDPAEAAVYATFQDKRGQLDFWLRRGTRLEALRVISNGEVADEALGGKLAREIIVSDDPKAGQVDAFCWLWGRDCEFCEQHLAEALGKTAASTNALVSRVGRLLASGNFHCTYGEKTPAFALDWPAAVRTWRLYRGLCAGAGCKPAFAPTRNAVMAFAGLGDRAAAVAAADEGLANAAIKPEERAELRLMAGILKLTGDEDAVAAGVKKLVEEVAKDCPAKEMRKRYERAAAVAVVSCDDALARGVAKFYRGAMDVLKEPVVYTVRFSERPVGGAAGLATLPERPEESPFARSFGSDKLSFMLTDVSSGDRGNAAQGGKQEREHPVTLQVVADEWGVHFFYTFYDRRARQFESGELNAGSYESYLAPGDNQPYMCIMAYPRKDAVASIMNTPYNTPGHRRADPKDLRSFRSDTLFEDDRVVTYLAFSWDSFADHVPVDGGEWNFESVFWGPVPCAWNGTRTIHGRSSWGRLRFALGEAARVKILRAQLFKAVNAYRAEQQPQGGFATSPQLGVFDHWKDTAIGDPAFYAEVLKPLEERLDGVAARVKIGMSDDEVKEIVENHFAEFHDIRFTVARLRTEYLAKKRLAE